MLSKVSTLRDSSLFWQSGAAAGTLAATGSGDKSARMALDGNAPFIVFDDADLDVDGVGAMESNELAWAVGRDWDVGRTFRVVDVRDCGFIGFEGEVIFTAAAPVGGIGR